MRPQTDTHADARDHNTFLVAKCNDAYLLNMTVCCLETGRLMARFCVAFETMKIFHGITGRETMEELASLADSLTECSTLLIMVTLCNRADHYIFILWFLSSIFFPRLISAVGDWMSTILRHMVWS